MGLWNNHGMVEDDEVIQDAVDALGFFPDELVVLADNAQKEAWIWDKLADHKRGSEKRKAHLISGHWKRRARRWKELAALAEHDFDEVVKEMKENKKK
jgi:hypothetical protein